MSLEMTEEWVKKRANITGDELDDVKTLNLPGTYHEKVSSIGNALVQFTRLKHLDLSKNNITSLKGLEHLKLLETLNLYYNKVNDLKEIFRIRNCQNILNMDLRLNPVTGNEPDYRLFIAHMLPKLQRLDDRPLRDSERKSALLHFSSTELADGLMIKEMTNERPGSKAMNREEKSRQPRVEQVKNMIRKPSFVTDQDTVTDVIDHVDRASSCSSDKENGSRSKMHSKQELLDIVRKENELYKKKLNRQNIEAEKYQASTNTNNNTGNNSGGGLSVIKKNFDREHRQFADEEAAYHQYRSAANYTPHPGTDEPPPTVHKKTSNAGSSESELNGEEEEEMSEYKRLPESKSPDFGESTTNQEQSRCRNLNQIKFLESILDLVDRYWNGSQSLHHHQKFQARAQGPIDQFEREMTSSKDAHMKVLQDKVTAQTHEIQNLHHKLHQMNMSKQTSKNDLKELESVKARAQAANSDNKILRIKISELEKKVQEYKNKTSCEDDRVSELEIQKKELVQQVASLKINLEQQERNNQLTSMLQDSHKSIVASNDHLLAELEEVKARHQTEVDQLKWTYDQLRSTTKLANGHVYSDNEF